jgi:hypothetical protein
VISLYRIEIPWHRRKLRFPVPGGSDVQVLAPTYPPALKPRQIKAVVERSSVAAEAGLTGFGGGNEAMRILYLPYAPITLVR